LPSLDKIIIIDYNGLLISVVLSIKGIKMKVYSEREKSLLIANMLKFASSNKPQFDLAQGFINYWIQTHGDNALDDLSWMTDWMADSTLKFLQDVDRDIAEKCRRLYIYQEAVRNDEPLAIAA